jgi:uncharacterized protein YndB with AHSA1/START domain
MDNETYVYVTYIAASPEKVWNALTDAEMTKDYWFRRRNASDWKPGSRWEHQHYDDPAAVDCVGTVVECDPPRRLVLTWAAPSGPAKEDGESKVTFLIEPVTDAVRLTVTHEDLKPGGAMLEGISEGWPAVLSGLKTLLETGHPLTMNTSL